MSTFNKHYRRRAMPEPYFEAELEPDAECESRVYINVYESGKLLGTLETTPTRARQLAEYINAYPSGTELPAWAKEATAWGAESLKRIPTRR
jgi:hypothetical protein